jgi:hypothetical protein
LCGVFFTNCSNKHLSDFSSKKEEFTDKDRKLALIICTNFLLYSISIWTSFMFYFSLGKAVLEMKMQIGCFFRTSTLINIMAIILITIDWSKHKEKLHQTQNLKPLQIFYTLGLVLILSRILGENVVLIAKLQ